MSIARGILKGFIGQAVDTKVAEDKRLADLTDKISETYLNTTLPNFLEKENILKSRYDTVKAKDETLAKFGLAKGLYNTKAGYETLLNADKPFIDKLKSANINFGDYDYSSGAITRSMNFNERNKKTQDSLINNQFGKNTVDFMIKAPVPEGAQPSTFDTSTVPSMSELGLLPSGVDSDFTEKGEFRIRQNNAVERAIQVSGLNSKISKDDFGNISVTAIDEADQSKLDFITSETTKRYSQNFQRLDFANIGNESVAYVNTLDRASKGFKEETDKTFASYQLEASSELANSENRVIPLEGGQKITAYELFLNKNDTLLRLYKEASTQGRRFIKKQYNALTPNKSGYYSFFKRIDEELEKEENS